jgi:hypothetical protein
MALKLPVIKQRHIYYPKDNGFAMSQLIEIFLSLSHPQKVLQLHFSITNSAKKCN